MKFLLTVMELGDVVVHKLQNAASCLNIVVIKKNFNNFNNFNHLFYFSSDQNFESVNAWFHG